MAAALQIVINSGLMANEKHLDARYRRRFGYHAGYLPRDRKAVDDFHRELLKTLAKTRALGERREVKSVA